LIIKKKGIKNRYKVIPRTLVFISNRGRFLLINQASQEKIGYERWNGVGGHVEKGENPLEAAKREVYEETGLIISNLKLKYISLVEGDENTGVCLFIFQGYSNNLKLLKSNEGKINWFSIPELNNLKTMADVPQLIELINKSVDDSSVNILIYSSSKNEELRIDVLG